MGTYFQPQDIEDSDKLTDPGGSLEERYEALKEQSSSDGDFIGSYWRSIPGFVNIVKLYSFNEFCEFERQVADGLLERRGYYQMPIAP